LTKFLPDGKKTLVITSCSKTKKKIRKKIKAIERYKGQMFCMTVKFANQNNYDILILSAKYGVLKPNDKIGYYNKQINNQNDIFNLKPKVITKLSKIIENENYEKIIIIMGEKYRSLITELIDDRYLIMESKNGLFDYFSKLKKLFDLNDF